MTKERLSFAISERLDVSHNVGRQITDAFFDVIKGMLKEGHDVKIRNFGSWNLTSCGERRARNPKTGELVVVPPAKRVRFKVSQSFKKEIA